MGLAPMAVRPDCQRQGIGSLLVRRGLNMLAERGCPVCRRRRTPGVLPALRVRTRVAARPCEPVGRHARRGLHGDDPRPAGHDRRARRCQVSRRVRRGRVSVLPQITICDASGRDVVARFRGASLEDVPAIERLIALSARGLSRGDYSEDQIEAALGTALGVDSQLIADGTYFVAEVDETLVACGGWSRRKTLFGGDAATPPVSRSCWIPRATRPGSAPSSSTRTGPAGALAARRSSSAKAKRVAAASRRPS